jgi:hypothetical protein
MTKRQISAAQELAALWAQQHPTASVQEHTVYIETKY